VLESELQEIHLDNTGHIFPEKLSKDSEYWEFLLMMGFGNISATQQLFEKLRAEIAEDDWRRPLLLLGEARFLQISGRDLECFLQLEEVSKIIFPQSNILNDNIQSETMSLFSYTQSNLQEKIGQSVNILPLLTSGSKLTSIASFKLAFEYRILLKQVIISKATLQDFVSIVDKLIKSNLRVLACLGYRTIGILHRQQKNYKKAHHYFNLALNMAERMDLRVNRNQILNAKAYALFHQGKLEAAEELYAKITPEGRLDSIIPILNENLALLAENRQDMSRSIKHMKIALSVSSELDSVGYVPGECLYLGQAYEKYMDDLDQAEHYYRLGYEHSMRYASHGISLTGDRREVVETYVNFISRNKRRGKTTKPGPEKDIFAFSKGKSWKDIKDIFQHQLICFHSVDLKNGKLLAAKLDMPASTLYSLQDRLKARGFELPRKDESPPVEDLELHDFFIEHQDLSWDEANQIFEREIMHYLYERYGYNKHRMAKILELSYPSIIKMTRELTQVNEHFLTN